MRLSDLFPEGPDENTYIIVQLPAPGNAGVVYGQLHLSNELVHCTNHSYTSSCGKGNKRRTTEDEFQGKSSVLGKFSLYSVLNILMFL